MDKYNITIWGLSFYSFGWECRVDLQEKETGRIFNMSYGWDHEPSDGEIDDAIAIVLDRVETIKENESNYTPVEIEP